MTTHEDAIADAQDDLAFAEACCSKNVGEIVLSPVVVDNAHLADVIAVCLKSDLRMSCSWQAGAGEALERRLDIDGVTVRVVEHGKKFEADLSAVEPSFRERYAAAAADLVGISDAALLPTTREVFNEQMRQFQEMSAPQQVAVLQGEYPTDEGIFAEWEKAHRNIIDELNEVASEAVHA